ncbi:hypothetical protein FRC04_007043, partial [Tulasnella sp. 424]
MSTLKFSADVKRRWDALTLYAESMDLTEYGLGILHPGCCIAILPEDGNPESDLGDDDLWYGVYLKTGADEDDNLYMKIVWFYTPDQAVSQLSSRKDRKLREIINALPPDELILSNHGDVIEQLSIN